MSLPAVAHATSAQQNLQAMSVLRHDEESLTMHVLVCVCVGGGALLLSLIESSIPVTGTEVLIIGDTPTIRLRKGKGILCHVSSAVLVVACVHLLCV